MRKPQVRLSCPHASVVGAQLAAAKRLYELIVGAVKIASSLRHAICPARYCSKTSDSPANAFSPSRQRLEWTWQEFPIQAWSGLAMKGIEQPFRCAVSFAPFL